MYDTYSYFVRNLSPTDPEFTKSSEAGFVMLYYKHFISIRKRARADNGASSASNQLFFRSVFHMI
jgi:hypothetical protein